MSQRNYVCQIPGQQLNERFDHVAYAYRHIITEANEDMNKVRYFPRSWRSLATNSCKFWTKVFGRKEAEILTCGLLQLLSLHKLLIKNPNDQQ